MSLRHVLGVDIGLLGGIWGSDFKGGLFTILLSTLWWISSLLFAIGAKYREPVG